MASQTAADLRTLVTRRVGLKRRVAVLASDLTLVRAIEANGCTVLVDPPSLDELRGFAPDVVVVFDGFLLQGRDDALRALSGACGSASLLISFANAASASALLQGLLGRSPPVALSEADVRQWLTGAGYVVEARDAVVTVPPPTSLSADTEAALRQLFEQVNADAAIDRLLLVAKRGIAASPPDRTPGLVSVIVSGGSSLPALTGTVSSLVNQHRRPLELVVVANLAPEALDEAVAKARTRSGVTVLVKTLASADAAARTNVGLGLAQGQYVAFAEAGELFEPLHLTGLVKRLEEGTSAWALGASRVSGQPLAPRPAQFSLAAWLRAGWLGRSEWVIDRARLGAFALTFAEGVEGFEAIVFARLGLLFPPAWQAGAPTVERLTPMASTLEPLLEAMRSRPLRGLVPLKELLQESEPPALKSMLKERLAGVDPRLAHAFEVAAGAAKRTAEAWRTARAAAEKELRQKP